jgi:hypothetical protein
MDSKHNGVPEREQRLDEVVTAYLQAVEAGQQPDRQELLVHHADLLPELAQFFEDADALGGLSIRRGGGMPAAGLDSGVVSQDMAAGKQFGDFSIVREVGRGGMGVVYEAEQISLRRRVALKVLPFAATMDPRLLQRFHNEAQAAACLHHTNIVPVHFVGCERGVHFYAMQFIDGQPLSEIIRQLRRAENPESVAGKERTPAYQPPPEAATQTNPTTRPVAEITPLTSEGRRSRGYYRKVAELGVQAAAALDHAHQLGIVHRDIKPANLLLDGRGNLWVTDFGLAHIQHGEASLTLTGQAVGTPRYMSPEQALTQRVPIDHRTDVFSLGVTLYELLTLRPAFAKEDRQELLRQIAYEEPTRPCRLERTIPAELETIVLKAMEKRPQDRYATAQELADDLRHWLHDMPIRARRPTLLQQAAKWMRRHRALARAGVGFLVLAVFLLSTSTWMIWRANLETKAALARADAKSRWARRAVNDMYTDVAEKWLATEPNMTELQRQFLRKAMDYYEELAHEKSMDPDERLETGIAYRRLGHMHDLSFQHEEGSNEHFEHAIAIFEDLASEYPTNVTYQKELSRSYYELGHYLKSHTLYPEAEKYLRKAQSSIDTQDNYFPDSPDRQRDLADIKRELGELFQTTHRENQAEGMFSDAVRIYERLAQRFPEEISYQRELASSYFNLSEYKANRRELPEAERFARQALDSLEKSQQGAGPESWRTRNKRGAIYNKLADILLDRGHLKDAEAALCQSLEVRRKLYEDFSVVPAVCHGLAITYSNQGRLMLHLCRPREAAEAYRQALHYLQKVLQHEPEQRSRRQEFVVLSSRLSWLYLLGPDTVRDVRRALPLIEKIQELEPNRAHHQTARGVAQYQLGQVESAINSFRLSLQSNDRTEPLLGNWVSDVYHIRRVAERDARGDHPQQLVPSQVLPEARGSSHGA